VTSSTLARANWSSRFSVWPPSSAAWRMTVNTSRRSVRSGCSWSKTWLPQIAVARDQHQGLVQVVRNAAGQLSDCTHLL
jgi:hypothetical protein